MAVDNNEGNIVQFTPRTDILSRLRNNKTPTSPRLDYQGLIECVAGNLQNGANIGEVVTYLYRIANEIRIDVERGRIM